jgi:hypothetical protein
VEQPTESAIERAVSAQMNLPPRRPKRRTAWLFVVPLALAGGALAWHQVLEPSQATATVSKSSAAPMRMLEELLIDPELEEVVAEGETAEDELGELVEEVTLVSAPSPMPSPQIRGALSVPSDMAPSANFAMPEVGPVIVTPAEVQPAAPKAQEAVLVRANFEGDAGALAGAIAAAGGEAKRVATEGGELLFAAVPPEKLEELMAAASSSGLAVRTETWEGSPSARRQRLVEAVEERIVGLKLRRDELLATYYEDAVPVRHVDEDLANAVAELEQLRAYRVPEGRALVVFALRS